jgi:hypothetical protein
VRNPTGNPIFAVIAACLAALGLVLAICLFAPWFGQSTRLVGAAIGRFLPTCLRARTDRLLDELAPFQAFPLARHLSLAATSFSSFTVGILVRVMIMKSLNFDVPLLTIIWVDALLAVTSHVPITIGNFGVREGLVVAAFELYGVPADVAVAYSLLIYGCRIPLALIGAGYQLALVAGLTSMRSKSGDRRALPAAQVAADESLLKTR